ncbi:hypothetical protein A0J61_05057 [Choanephora cucurbitarum]|uniref:Uncharacterized protein n=1 Tax=Choanephora cucurbitarum TaxID=101091 RepID=A0A1C7NCR9_9FUNG|nr:hypothetical protein A0J61_05059 [Choanephora cucurbitarum]OBZ86893.1 hypothetical protein A0J61_05057 [Choanephora cucurbitarum]
MDTANLQWKRFSVQDLDRYDASPLAQVNEEANNSFNPEDDAETNQPQETTVTVRRYSRDQMHDLNKTTPDEMGSVCGRLVESYLEMGRMERRRWQNHERTLGTTEDPNSTENCAPLPDMMPTTHTIPGIAPANDKTQDEFRDSATYRKYIKVTLGLKTSKHAGI